ncbi:MAG: SUMF1/EgtB/PvdO family nonheme iron enzyme [Labilibaculum antarcticum]
MRRSIYFFFLFFSFYVGKANNLKIDGVVELENETATNVDLKFNVSWANSWRYGNSWDSAWVFLKYQLPGGEWKHVYLSESGNVETNGNASVELGKTDSDVVGVFVYRNGEGSGATNFSLSLSWAYVNNGLLQADLAGIRINAFAIEMVRVPTAAYKLGDAVSNQSFGTPLILPPYEDVIDQNSGYVYSMFGEQYPASYAADQLDAASARVSCAYAISSTNEFWWKVDFKLPKTIYCFGWNILPNYGPDGAYWLQASNDDVVWTDVWTGTDGYVYYEPGVPTYPVSVLADVTNPGSYRYYRIKMKGVSTRAYICNVAMTEELVAISPYNVRSEDELNLIAGYVGTVPAAYPKGYQGFYCMKYEVTQEQYVDFLNSLPYAAQDDRIDILPNQPVGTGIVNALRNGIRIYQPGVSSAAPAIYGLDLDGDGIFYEPEDGGAIACNYLNRDDAYSYADWAGLRPMTELEYEKAARGLASEAEADFAWGVSPPVFVAGIESGSEGSVREKPLLVSANVNGGNAVLGPMRVGAFANAGSTRLTSGASFWGIMDLSGNLDERCVAVGGYNKFVGGHGNGSILATTYGCDIANWYTDGKYNSMRGGCYLSTWDLLLLSNRTYTYSEYNTRTEYFGFRAVRTAP